MKLNKLIKKVPIIEGSIIVITISFIIISKIIPNIAAQIEKISVDLNGYFSESRLSLIVNAAFILVGVYATITSVFGSSRSAATSRLSEKDLTKNFIGYIGLAIMSALIAPLYIIFLNYKNIYVLVVLLIWMVLCLIRFLIIILLIYNYNVFTSKKMDIEDNKKYNELLDILTQINIEIKKNRL